MACISPLLIKSTGWTVSCGQCMPCRVRRQREWITKLYLQYRDSGSAIFVTLTYSPETVPANGTLLKSDLQKFLKRYRKNFKRLTGTDSKIRYFGVGEYGEKSLRPHYHLIMYGDRSYSRMVVNKSWQKGYVMVRPIEGAGGMKDSLNSIRYTSGYTLKKMTQKGCMGEDMEPEFCIMSKHPALGSGLDQYFADFCLREGLYPARSLTTEQMFVHSRLMERKFIEWDGNFFLSDKGTISIIDTARIEALIPERFQGDLRMHVFRKYLNQKYGVRMRLDSVRMKSILDHMDAWMRSDLDETISSFSLHRRRQFAFYSDLRKHKLYNDIIVNGGTDEEKAQIEDFAERIARRVSEKKAL